MDPKVRNAHLGLSPDESDPKEIAKAQLGLIAVKLAEHEVSLTCADDLVKFLESLDEETKLVTDIHTSEQRQTCAQQWENIAFLVRFFVAAADAEINALGEVAGNDILLPGDTSRHERWLQVMDELRGNEDSSQTTNQPPSTD